jgi:hypothetical protein
MNRAEIAKKAVEKTQKLRETYGNVRFVGPSVTGSPYFRIVASGNGKVEYGPPSYVKKR